MNKQIKALKMAIDWIEADWKPTNKEAVLKTCKEALAEAEQKEKQKEAFAEMVKLNQEMGGYEAEKQEPVKVVASGKSTWVDVKPTWQSLSNDEIDNIWSMNFEFGFRACARAIEQALKEKNYDLHKG